MQKATFLLLLDDAVPIGTFATKTAAALGAYQYVFDRVMRYPGYLADFVGQRDDETDDGYLNRLVGMVTAEIDGCTAKANQRMLRRLGSRLTIQHWEQSLIPRQTGGRKDSPS